MTTKIRVLIVDDSRMIRDVLTDILAEQPDIEVVGAAADAFEARDMIKSLNPDVLTLDIERDDVGLHVPDQVARLEGVGGGTHHLDVGLLVEDAREHVADQLRIVDDQDADHGGVRHGLGVHHLKSSAAPSMGPWKSRAP